MSLLLLFNSFVDTGGGPPPPTDTGFGAGTSGLTALGASTGLADVGGTSIGPLGGRSHVAGIGTTGTSRTGGGRTGVT